MGSDVYVCDFETTTNPEDCRVWAWGAFNIFTDEFIYGNTLSGFFEWIFSQNTIMIYFHNLKFDFEFMLYYLFENGFAHTESKKLNNKEFTTLITDMGVFYSARIMNKSKAYYVQDSLKIIPISVKEVSEAFGIEEEKGVINYDKFREVGYKLNDKEVSYLKKDCLIIARALKYFYDNDLKKQTIASNALNCFIKLIGGKSKLKRYFPVLEMDSELRRSYRGGFTFVNEKYQNKIVGEGIVLDVNSEYPFIMYTKMLPYGNPIFYTGKYKKCEFYTLYIQKIRCSFELKEGFLPTIQLKNNSRFVGTQYLKSSNKEEEVLVLTSVDLDLFLKHYEIFNLEYLDGWKFKASDQFFKEYIDKWVKEKQDATVTGNVGKRTIAKLLLNSLYGKFGTNPVFKGKEPIFVDGLVKYRTTEGEEREPLYIPMASFITSYARELTISAAQANIERFLYADTDSIHLLGTSIPTGIEVDDTKLGAWDKEATFSRAKYIRPKSYIEEINGEVVVTVAGLPESCREYITFDNFNKGLTVYGKLQMKRVKGGIVLIETTFTIKI